MPVTVSYPGVYVQEIASGQQTIGGVATSITSFVGRAYRGPVNQAKTIYSFGDFQRTFGGLANGFPMTFAVRDFFQNGGTQAIIVRIYGPSWLDFPVQSEQQSLAAGAVTTVMGAVEGAMPSGAQLASTDIAAAAEAAAASYAGGTYPEQAQAANWMAAQAGNWAAAVGVAQVTGQAGLQPYLGQVTVQMNAGANNVLTAIESPLSYPNVAFPSSELTIPASSPASPTNVFPDATSVVEVALETAQNQVPGPAQDAAYLVANAVQAEYDQNPATADFYTLANAAAGAVDDVSAALAALSGVTATGVSADAYLAGLAVEVGNQTAVKGATQESAAMIGVNALLAKVYPAFQLATLPTLPAGTTELGTQFMTELSTGGVESPAVAAAVPSTTASIQIQAPANFVAVAQAANSVAQAAWLASFGQANTSNPTQAGMAVSKAATEAAAYVKATNPTLPQATQAATAVSNAVAGKLTSGAAAAATAGTNAVATAVATALQLATNNGAVQALASGQMVALAAWTGGSVTTAVSQAPSLPAAQAAEALYTGASSQTAQVGGLAVSTGVVTAVTGTLPMLTLYAANAGEWANGSLSVVFNTTGITASVVQAMNLAPAPGNPAFGTGDLFNLQATYTAPDGSTIAETWNTVSLRSDAGGQRIDRVLSESLLLQYFWAGYTPGAAYPTGTPQPLPVPGAAGVAGLPAIAATPAYGAVQSQAQVTAAQETAALAGTPSAPLQLEDFLQEQATHTGIYALDLVDQFDLLCIPPDTQIDAIPPAIPAADPDDTWRLELYQTAAQYCQTKYAMLILDPPSSWAIEAAAGNTNQISIEDLGTYGPEGEYAAVYFPYLIEGNPLLNGQLGYFAPSGAMAGIMSRTDAARGVWKAPAGVNDGAISGTMGLELKLSDLDSGLLNPQGINVLRTFPVYGNVVWGARTLKGADVLNSDYKYVPVRRLALYIEASLLRGLQWAVFEPNAEPLWSSIRLSVNSFMNTLYRQGAFSGSTAKDAYFVACDATTTSATDIAQGKVNVTVGFAPLLPAEFVVITIQQLAGQTPS